MHRPVNLWVCRCYAQPTWTPASPIPPSIGPANLADTNPEQSPIIDRTREAMRAGRLTAADVASFTLDAILQRRFYVLPHRKASLGVEHRLRDFLAGSAPNNPLKGA
ncbi:hypothetical protein LP416_02385 [Polaromonas sp. P2-4]|nr:hypothetical protein LP416_02385 [Polaromonas sp. P2-4]